MRVRILKFPDGRTAVAKGLRIRINKQVPEEIYEVDVDKRELNEMLKKPHKQAFRIKGRKPLKPKNSPIT